MQCMKYNLRHFQTSNISSYMLCCDSECSKQHDWKSLSSYWVLVGLSDSKSKSFENRYMLQNSKGWKDCLFDMLNQMYSVRNTASLFKHIRAMYWTDLWAYEQNTSETRSELISTNKYDASYWWQTLTPSLSDYYDLNKGCVSISWKLRAVWNLIRGKQYLEPHENLQH